MTKRVTLITGASSGIGAELARIFASNGHDTVLVVRRDDRLKLLADEIAAAGHPRPALITSDLCVTGACEQIASQLKAMDVEVDTVVNNAGYGLFGEALDLDREQQLAMVDLNVRVLTDLTLRFADSLVRHRGGILNVASIASFLPGPRMAVYYATKAYVLSFTEAMRGELGPKGVRVTALCPGTVPTEFQGVAGFKPGLDSAVLNVSAAAVARAGYRGLMSNKRLVLPGVGVRMIPFMLRFAPRSLVLASVARVQQKR
ncbi:MAG: SDR family oxidoreductase [Bradyrhizobiaceae bacterium]|nr:MAG: SDR family oxidoreductase [Bradyrhizobiaceae bacterium]